MVYLIRVSPDVDYYRFSLSCNGQVRLDRVIGGQASSPQPWMMSRVGTAGGTQLITASEYPLMVATFDFFVNGQFQFSINDPMLTTGRGGSIRTLDKQHGSDSEFLRPDRV